MPRTPPSGVAIIHVERDSPAWQRGVRAGDRITLINRRTAEDALAAVFALGSTTDPATVTITSTDGPRRLMLVDADAFLAGITLAPLQTHSCTNDCVYCFCKQNPPDARASLLFRDEDYRLSFLTGNYLTLSALTDRELTRIINDRLQPLYVTVPATDEDLRRFMLGVRKARPLMTTLRALVDSGISVHAQVVVCPGLNDGANLDQTLSDLASLRPGVASVALVPVGTTRYTVDPRVRRPSARELREMLDCAGRWRMTPRSVPPWALVSDEVFLSLGQPVPHRAAYGESPQLSTGVGMVRRFLDDATRLRRRKAPSWWGSHRLAFVTGELFSPVLGAEIDALNHRWGSNALLVPVKNRYFGASVTVAGLLGGTEIRDEILARHVDAVVLPADALMPESMRFIDDTDLPVVKKAAGVPVVTAELLCEALEKVGAILK